MKEIIKNDPQGILIFELLHEREKAKKYLETLKKEIAHVKEVIKYTNLSLKSGKRIYP